MSLPDSLRLTLSTFTSNASGASVGMEAGYTQFGAAVFSFCARYLRLRREDCRIFVTAGAAAAISAPSMRRWRARSMASSWCTAAIPRARWRRSPWRL